MRDTGLPIESVIGEITSALDIAGLGVLTAEPGAGKTTVVPIRILEENWVDGRILVLEPRRVAARAVARRMAQLLGEDVGETVGWRTRDDRRVGPKTRIEVITEGILTRRLQNDASLPGVAAVLFDEFHERSVHADLGLALALEARETVRPDLRILIMSATIDAPAVAALLGGDPGPAPIIDCPGRTFPIDVRWRPRKGRDKLELSVANAVDEALEEPGDVLVFLPGVGEIRRATAEISRRTEAAVLPLYGALAPAEQDAALRTLPSQRRVVVATDVAETSLTVDGIGSVVDAGLARRPRYDAASGLTKLVTISHSKASADQRAGRAGRLGPGVAFRLWSKMEHASRQRHEDAEILQIDLASVVLESLAWGARTPADLRLLDVPKSGAIDEAFAVLELLGAVNEDRRLTADGRRMLDLPLHPRLAAMVAAVGDGPLGWPAAVLAALLGERDVLTGRFSDRPIDLWTRVRLVAEPDFRTPNTDVGALGTVRRRARDLLGRTGASEGPISIDDLGRSLSLAYPDRIAQKRAGQGGRFRMANGMGAEADKSDPLAHEEMLVIPEISGDKRQVRIRLATGIDALDVELGFASSITERTFFGWDEDRDDLVSRVERRLGALDFGTHVEPVVAGEQATEALVDQIVATKLAALPWTDAARQLQARLSLIAEHRPAAIEARLDDKALIADAHEVFGPFLNGATGRADIERLKLVQVFLARLSWEETEELDRLAPTNFRFAKGRERLIDYTAEALKVSVRAQDAFGTKVTPSVVDGAVAIAVELLSPADRPIQITSDLGSFWSGSWASVRKDMAGRYPKHDWPEDPC